MKRITKKMIVEFADALSKRDKKHLLAQHKSGELGRKHMSVGLWVRNILRTIDSFAEWGAHELDDEWQRVVDKFAAMSVAPDNWTYHHHKDCSTKYRGCHPKACPKNVWEQSGVWIG